MDKVFWWLRQTEKDILEEFATMSGLSSIGDANDWVYIEGTNQNPVCIVAHADTVHRTEPSKIYHDSKAQVCWSPSGLGADDRAGCYAAWKLWYKLKGKHSVLITTGEESGGIGARNAAANLGDDLEKNSFFIQLDRKGHSDAVFYDVSTNEFEDYILESLPRFKQEHGSFTDICILCPTAGRCGVNLSIGYRNEHTKHEYLNLKSMEKTIGDIAQFLKKGEMPIYKMDKRTITPRKTYTYGQGGIFFQQNRDGWGNVLKPPTKPTVKRAEEPSRLHELTDKIPPKTLKKEEWMASDHTPQHEDFFCSRCLETLPTLDRYYHWDDHDGYWCEKCAKEVEGESYDSCNGTDMPDIPDEQGVL